MAVTIKKYLILNYFFVTIVSLFSHGGYRGLMIVDLLKSAAVTAKEHVAIEFKDHAITYAELLKIITKVTNGLIGHEIKKGDQVAIILPNTPHFIFAYYATLRTGAIVVPINPFSRSDDLDVIFDRLEPRAVFIWEGFLARFNKYIHDFPKKFILGEGSHQLGINLQSFIAKSSDTEIDDTVVDESDDAVYYFTSGVTGAPKCVELTHENLTSVVTDLYDVIPATHADKFGGILPLSLLYAQMLIMNVALTRGARISLYPRIDRPTLEQALFEDKITILIASSSLLRTMIDEFKDRVAAKQTALKYVFTLGSPGNSTAAEEFEATFNVPVLEGYGLAESSAIVSFNRVLGHRKHGTVGLPLSTLEVKIIDDNANKLNPGEVGEIAIRGKAVMKGYTNAVHAVPLDDGWFNTQDVGKVDEEGYLWFLERKDDIIVKSGFTIFPTEIENKLKEHPKIKELCIVGVPHTTFKQEVKACIVLKEGESADPEEFREFCKERIPVYQRPQIFQFYDSLPKSSFGKVIRKKLRDS